MVIRAPAAASSSAPAADAAGYGVGLRRVSFTDPSRPIRPAHGFAGAPERRLDLIVWYPTDGDDGRPAEGAPPAGGGPWPLVIYSHGTFGRADNASHIAEDLAGRGYVVAAPDYPLTSRAAFTRVSGPDIGDVVEQVRDLSFIIDRLLADPVFGPAIDARQIAAMGHSLGAVTSYFACFGVQTRDARIKAAVLIGAGDPVQAALWTDMGLAGTRHAEVSTPVLFVSGEKDVFARMTGRPHAAWFRLEKPKYEVMIRGAPHVWFLDEMIRPADGRNPDCLFFEENMPGVVAAGCEERHGLIDPARQQAITRAAVGGFLDGWLKRDAGALGRLRGLGRAFRGVRVLREE